MTDQPSARALDEFLLQVARHKFVAGKLHDERSTATCERTE